MIEPAFCVLANGRLDLGFLSLPGVELRAAGPEIVFQYAGQSHVWKPTLQPATTGWEARSVGFGLAVELRATRQGMVLTLRNEGSERLSIARIAPLAVDATGSCRVGASPRSWSVYRQGYQSWTGTRSFRVHETDLDPWPHPIAISLIDLRNRSPQKPGCFRSDMFGVVKNLDSGDVLLAGFRDGSRAFGGVEVWVEENRCTRFAASLDYDDVPLDVGAEIVTPPLWIAAGNDEHGLIATFSDAVATTMRARPVVPNPVGWCSWYYYFTDINEERITENLAALQRLPGRLRFDYFQVDDGYQAEIGDWTTTNAKFPRGMAWVAEQIRAAGFTPGLWTAPFIAKPESRVLREHPEWFVKNEDGAPRFALWNPAWGMRSSCYALDTTHPEALDWLREVFRTLAQEWGYRVLKLDFLYAAALPGRRFDPQATRAMALRRGLDAVREGAGDEAFLLGCGCPLAPAVGVVDAMRIGPDVAPWWTNLFSRTVQRNQHGISTFHAVRNTLTRAYTHQRWWLNDPDCLMVRDTDTALTEHEVRTLATVIAMTDGMIIFSDRIESLSPARVELLERTLELAGGKVWVSDLLHHDVPEVVVSRAAHQTVVAAFNFADTPQPKRLDLAALRVDAAPALPLRDWWTDTPITVQDGQADLGIVPPHGCRVLVLPH